LIVAEIAMLFAGLVAETACAAVPLDNPVAGYGLDWTKRIPWNKVVSIADVEGANVAERIQKAQAMLTANGGGVVYFPAGVYEISDHVAVADGIVWRGEVPVAATSAHTPRFDPLTRFVFPAYKPVLTGDGTPITTAFKGIRLVDPAMASRCGVVHLKIESGHIDFGESSDHRCGSERLVFGCVLTNAAVADPAVPDRKIGQHAWQRFTARHHAAIAIRSASNALIANNRLPQSGGASFTMPNYVVAGRGKEAKPVVLPEVVFDYDNRPGIYVNDAGLGGAGGNPPDGTPQTHPFGFRRGIIIADNYIYSTGRCAISFSGDGTICRNNLIRFAKDVERPTVTGRDLSSGASTNDNRAIQMRGWRWTVEGNDYEVFRNWAAGRKYLINDGEGLMHEDHVNSTVKDSKLIGNKGNAYISIYKTGGIDGLLIERNDIQTGGGIAAIFVVADRNKSRHECRNVTIRDNITSGGGIDIAGHPASNNVVSKNRDLSGRGRIRNAAEAVVEGNNGYTVVRD
jgi:hypothetical protein